MRYAPGLLPSMAYTSSEKFLQQNEKQLSGRDVEPESIEPADCNGLKEDCDKEREASRVVLQQVEDVEPALSCAMFSNSHPDCLTGVTQVIATA